MNRLIYFSLVFTIVTSVPVFGQALDFSDAVIMQNSSGKRAGHFARILQEELEKRVGKPFLIQTDTISENRSQIVLSLYADRKSLPNRYIKGLENLQPQSPESYQIILQKDSLSTSFLIIGQDERGLLYGIGQLLRKMDWAMGKLNLPESLVGSSSPVYPIRGHQLGYRPKTNAYDAFTVERFEQYIRELALFGTNSIEIVPPRTDDDSSSRHMTLPAIEMISEQSRIADELDLDLWMWYPNMGEDYQNPDSQVTELAEREEVFAALTRLDHLFVPGGDPGDLDPDTLFAWLEKTAELLLEYHPGAKIWVSPQVFRPTQVWFDRFFHHINKGYPWLGGVVFGPWVKIPLPELRKLVQEGIPIRRYPDITHSLSSQYPIADWDLALAMTLGRECINPRPVDQKTIHNALDQLAVGSISYSEGTNDDLNKFVWTDQDWDPDRKVTETVRDYARFFFGSEWTEPVTQGLLAEEANLKGSLLTNNQVPQTLLQWQEMEARASSEMLGNFRFQMGLIRAYFDAYIQQKLLHDTQQEQLARNILDLANQMGSRWVIDTAMQILENPWKDPGAARLKERCIELANSLYQSIGAQLTIVPHGAAPGRGNFIDNLDAVLNDSPWLMDNLRSIATMEPEEARLRELKHLIHRTNPGPGGFYDNFGTPGSWGKVVHGKALIEDPGSLYGPRVSFGVGLIGEEWVHEVQAVGFEGKATPKAWMTQINTLFDTPLQIRYEDLNPDLKYRLKVAYTGRFRSKMKLSVDEDILIHDFIETGQQPVYSFPLPQSAYRDGSLTFTWTCGEGERGSQVAEIWIIPETE
ncbi:hypothetical protein SAMN04488057_102474 [Cyclobacterium lianum]|uniref:Glycosyl hydrolase family 20, domain 2 n=1 Tax=Cyclobacterium lianum TaxID=388280 RepID=A0A1M7KHT5_9BACT|nr:hypothetical protein [Cyclobacterium lianum]SHM64895.1 hypothetical protein SAMN04488057_102474 [Cyclobacterium lianum]